MQKEGKLPLSFKEFIKYRPFLYGLAALWIFFLHIPYKFPSNGAWKLLRVIQSNGACGVEIFVLLAGCSLYGSLKKNGLKTFYIRRAQRVWLPTFLIMVFVCTFMDYSFAKTLGTVSVFGYWFGMPATWFSAFISLMYLVYPLFYRMLNRHRNLFFVLCAISWPIALLSLILFDGALLPIRQGLTRIPVFMLGVALTPALLENRRIPRIFPLLFLAAACPLFLFSSFVSLPAGISYWMRTLTYTCLSFFLIPFFAFLARMILKCGFGRSVYKAVAFVGGISLEFYILFVTVGKAMLLLPVHTSQTDYLLNISFLGGVISIVLSVVMQKLCSMLIDAYSKTKLPE